uniref:Uncharacterized protein n=1 Tax=Setaria viridis TaxID=4556 RepID=A0A4U6UPR4_SETVI|nr:hypothetical protein SEVIR_5G298133v2 [Setaria viridis]
MIFPSRSAITETLESRAVWRSNPVPTMHFSDRESGTAWRCILELIKARFASLCSIKGMREPPIEKYWKGKILLT